MIPRVNAAVSAAVIAAFGAGAAANALQLWAGSVSNRDGVTYVANLGDALWSEQDPSPLRFELETTFGVEAEPREATLARIADVAVDAQDRAFVLDRQDDRIVAFAPDGSVIWTSGGPGEGPGELSRPTSIAWNGDSMLFRTNQSGTKLERWSVEGTFIEARMLSEFGIEGASIAGVLPRAPTRGFRGSRQRSESGKLVVGTLASLSSILHHVFQLA